MTAESACVYVTVCERVCFSVNPTHFSMDVVSSEAHFMHSYVPRDELNQ